MGKKNWGNEVNSSMKNILLFIDTQTTNNKKVSICRKKLNERKQNNYNLKTNLTFPLYKFDFEGLLYTKVGQSCNYFVKKLANAKYIFSKKKTKKKKTI